jgi:hypothetical protein
MRVYGETADTLRELAALPLSTSDVASVILSAGIEAIRQAGGKLSVPLQLKVVSEAREEPAHPKRAAA